MKINQYHRAVLQDYSNGDHAYLGELEVVDIEEIRAVGDGLLTFLMLELSDEEGCENPRGGPAPHLPGTG